MQTFMQARNSLTGNAWILNSENGAHLKPWGALQFAGQRFEQRRLAGTGRTQQQRQPALHAYHTRPNSMTTQ